MSEEVKVTAAKAEKDTAAKKPAAQKAEGTVAKKPAAKKADAEVKAEAKPAAKKTAVKAEAVEAKAEVKPAAKKPAAKQEGNQLKLTLIKSTIGSLENHKRTIQALGLKKIRSTAVHNDSAALQGMIFKVKHLIKVEKV